MPSLSRRSFLAGSASVAGVALAAGALPVSSAAADAISSSGLDAARAKARAALGPRTVTRPTGTDYVRYEDLYRSGDSVGGALARLTSPKVVTFPEGRFSARDFNSGYLGGISVPPICRGIVGSGPGTVGGSSGTVFTMDAWSSTKGNGARDGSGNLFVPKQDNSTPCQLHVLKQSNQVAPAIWKNFQVAGSEQGHIFSAFQVFGTAGANAFENLLVAGWSGDNGAPPGETSGLSVNGYGAHTMTAVEADGRRNVGGEVYGAMGLTYQNSSGATFTRCYSHDMRAANFVMFQSVNGYMVDCTSDAIVSGGKALGNGGINLERTTGWTIANPTILGRWQKVHLTHSNDNWAMTRYGLNVSARNGTLKVINPSFNDLWGNNLLVAQSWAPYGNGDTISSPPLVLGSDWSRHVTYKWIHNGAQTIS